jgi:exodeoxyribonuclease VII small subunit
VTDEIPSLNFEDALTELESLVDTLEKGELSLEDSLETFERGVKLTRACQEALKDAEQKVRMLSSQEPDGALEPYDPDD